MRIFMSNQTNLIIPKNHNLMIIKKGDSQTLKKKKILTSNVP